MLCAIILVVFSNIKISLIHIFISCDGSLIFSSFYFFHFIDISLCFSFQKKRKTVTRKKKDSDRLKQLNNWEETCPFFESNIPPHKIFELFLTDEEMEKIYLESINNARLKGDITLP